MNGAYSDETAAGHALDLLESAERDAFEARLAADPDLRLLTADLRDAALTLSLAAPQVEPPSGLRAAILAAADRPAPGEAGQVFAFPLTRLLPWAAAACLALTTGWFALRATSFEAANRTLDAQRELAETAYRMAQSQLAERSLLAEQMIADLGQRLQRSEDLGRLRVMSLASLQQEQADSRAVAVWDQDRQAGLLAVEKLPAVAADKDYQIWVIDPQYPIPVDGGVFKPGADGRATLTFKGDKPIAAATAFAISLERKGGVPKAEGPLVLLGKQ